MAENFDSNPPRTIQFSKFPDYVKFSEEYKPDAIDEAYKAENGKTIDEFIAPHAKDDGDKRAKKDLFYSLYAMQDREKKDPSSESISTRIDFGSNGELCLAMRCKNEGLGDFGLVVRDGKITFSAADLSPDQVKAAYHFLYMRGLTPNLVIPDNLAPDLKTNLEAAEKEYADTNGGEEKAPDVVAEGEELSKDELIGNEFNQWYHSKYSKNAEKTGEPAPKPKKDFGMKEAIAEVDEWGDKQGEVRGMNFFHLRESGGWHVWAAYKDMNPDNIYDEVKKDKNGNLSAKFRYKVYVREHKGKLEVGYAVPPGGELGKDTAEVMAKIASSAGYNAIAFHGVQDKDLYTLRKACAKELLVPIGISLKPDGCLKMIEDGRGYHAQGRKVAQFEKFLVEQIKKNAHAKGNKMNDNEKKLYEDVYVRSNLANFRPLYAGALKGKIDELAKDGGNAVKIIGTSNLIADFYEAYRDGVVAGVSAEGDSRVPTLEDILRSTVKENKDGKSVSRPFMTDAEIKEFKSISGVDISELTMPNVDPEHMLAIYNILIKKYEDSAKVLLDETYKNGGFTDNPQKVASTALRNVNSRLSEDVAKDFSGNINLDGIKSLANHGILLPAIASISNPHYQPTPEVEAARNANVAKRQKGLRNPMMDASSSNDQQEQDVNRRGKFSKNNTGYKKTTVR